jgi:hypothetical protein
MSKRNPPAPIWASNDYRKLWEIHAALYSGGVEREAILDLLEFLMEKVSEMEKVGP